MRYLLFLGAICGTFLLLACQSNENKAAKEAAAAEVYDTATKPLTVRFYMRYLDRDKRLKSTANFYRQGASKQEPLQLEGGVTVEGRNMKFKNLNNIELRYDDLYDVPAKESFDFQFNGFDGKKHTYTAQIPLINSFAVRTEIKKTTGFALEVEAKPLQERESLLLMFTDGNRNTETIRLDGPMNIAKTPISASAVKNLTLGRNELRLIRKRATPIKEKTYAGVCNADYYSEPIFVEVVED